MSFLRRAGRVASQAPFTAMFSAVSGPVGPPKIRLAQRRPSRCHRFPIYHLPPQAAPAAPAAPAASMDLKLEQLTKLGELKNAGVLTKAEFETQKARILA